MAGGASFRLYRRVLVGERAHLLLMAARADFLLRRGAAQLAVEETAMPVMAIRTADQAFLNAMVKWFEESGLGFSMAAITELRLRLDEQERLLPGLVHGMALRARHLADLVRGAFEVAMFLGV